MLRITVNREIAKAKLASSRHRCCQCCSTGKCKRCSCVTAGRHCIDCYPSKHRSCLNVVPTSHVTAQVSSSSQSHVTQTSSQGPGMAGRINGSAETGPPPNPLSQFDLGSIRSFCSESPVLPDIQLRRSSWMISYLEMITISWIRLFNFPAPSSSSCSQAWWPSSKSGHLCQPSNTERVAIFHSLWGSFYSTK